MTRSVATFFLIVYLTISLTACKESVITTEPQPSLFTSAPSITPEIKKQTTQPTFSDEKVNDYEGIWYSQDYKRVKMETQDDGFTGAKMVLNINESGTEGTIELNFISNPPASRIASVSTKLNFENKSKGIFVIDEDGWLSRGNGTIQFVDGKIDVSIKLDTVVSGNWRIFSGKKTFVRKMPETYFTNDDDSKKGQETTNISIPTHTVNFGVGIYKATLEIPTTWNENYKIKINEDGTYIYYNSKTLGDFLLFEVFEVQDSMWKEIQKEKQGESGNYYTLLYNKGTTDFVYRTHVNEGDPIEDEYNTMLDDFKKIISKSFKVSK